MGWSWLDSIVSNVSSALDFGKTLFNGAGNLANDFLNTVGITDDNQHRQGQEFLNDAVQTIDKIQGKVEPAKQVVEKAKEIYDDGKDVIDRGVKFAEDVKEKLKDEPVVESARRVLAPIIKTPSMNRPRMEIQPVIDKRKSVKLAGRRRRR